MNYNASKYLYFYTKIFCHENTAIQPHEEDNTFSFDCYIFSYPIGKLKTIDELETDTMMYCMYSKNTYPYDLINSIFDKNDFDVEINGCICDRSNLTEEEYILIKINMDNGEMINYILDSYESLYPTSVEATPSKEFPVKVFFRGHDDSSYTKVFDTVEAAEAFISRVKEIAICPAIINKILKEEMIFTN